MFELRLMSMLSGQRALFVVSIDLEMSWGAIHHGRPHATVPYSLERETVSQVLHLMEKYRISGTWAIVGHLFLSHCLLVDGIKHPEITRPSYRWHPADWYDLDPVSELDNEPTWYGPDLVDAIRGCSTHQEVASHSFGHIIAGDPGCDRDAFRTDLEECARAAEAAGVELRSFVYPRNSIGHLDVLEEAGFIAFRGHSPDPLQDVPAGRRHLLRLLDKLSPGASTAIRPRWEGDLVNIPQTYFFDPGSDTADRMGTTAWSWLVQRRLRQAIRFGSLFHVWFHPHTLAARQERAMKALDHLFRQARHEIEAGRLENLTMQALGRRWSALRES